MSLETIIEILKQAPLVALCILLVYGLKVIYSDAKKDRKYSKSEDVKNMETLSRVLEVVKENSLERRELSEALKAFTISINILNSRK